MRVSKKHKVMSEDARKSVPMKDGQEVLEIALGDVIFVVPLPTEPDKILHKYLGKYHFNRKLRKQAETMMVKEAAKSKF